MLKIYENKQFIILGDDGKRSKPAYVLYNKHKEFENGHTHLNNYRTALWIMKLYMQRKLPHDLKSAYLLQSLVRISNDKKYTEKVQQLINAKMGKSHNYYINVQKGVNKKRKR